VRFTVEINGNVSNSAVIGTSRPELNDLVLDAVKKWAFLPATKNGTPIAVEVIQKFEFRLSDE
jgi:TonB family protein